MHNHAMPIGLPQRRHRTLAKSRKLRERRRSARCRQARSKLGLSILPYIEEGSLQTAAITTDTLQQAPVVIYNCPSRRPPTREPLTGAFLIDYAAAVPSKARSQVPDDFDSDYLKPIAGADTRGCNRREFWGGAGKPWYETTNPSINDATNDNRTTVDSLGGEYAGMWGVIVRSDYCATCSTARRNTGFYKKITFNKITDGTSKTLVVSEKRMSPSQYLTGALARRSWLVRWLGSRHDAFHHL